MNKCLGRVKVREKLIARFSSEHIPQHTIAELVAGLNFAKAFAGETSFRNRFIEVDLTNYKMGSSCFIVSDAGSLKKTVICHVIDIMITKAYYDLLKKTTTNNPLAQSRLQIALNNMVRDLNGILDINALCANVILCELDLRENELTYKGNNPCAFMFDELFSNPINQNEQSIVEYIYTGPESGRVNTIIGNTMQIELEKYTPPGFFGVSVFSEDQVEIDSALAGFLRASRHHLSGVASQLYSLSMLSEVTKVEKFFNAGLVLQLALENLVPDVLEENVHVIAAPLSISSLLKEVYNFETSFDFSSNEKYDIVDKSRNYTFVTNFLNLRDMAVIGGHPSTDVSYQSNGLRIVTQGAYFTVNFPRLDDIKSYFVYLRRLIILSSALFSGGATFRNNKLYLNMKKMFEIELGLRDD